ncbi:MAG TPA: 50S ribosomal protein L18 [Candidatus Paceibacterota bacterium]|nr:50S ribosomal protein L18 [Candidatus Paceibacterota bacterium]
MNQRKALNSRKTRRVARTRSKIIGTAARPRLAVFRSNTSTYAQLIDDEARRTIVAASSRELPKKGAGLAKSAAATQVGELIAKKAAAAKIENVVLDRRSYAYHGRVKALAEGARKGGLKF